MLTKEKIVFYKNCSLEVSRNFQPTCVDGANGSFIGRTVEMYFVDEDKWYPRKLAYFNYDTVGKHCQSYRIDFTNGVVIWGIRFPNEMYSTSVQCNQFHSTPF